MKLSVNVVHQGCYVRAGEPLPPDFVLPSHLDRFVVHDDDDPSQISQGADRFSSAGTAEDIGAGGSLAKPATDYPEGEEEFVPQPKLTKGTKMAEEIRRAHQERRK